MEQMTITNNDFFGSKGGTFCSAYEVTRINNMADYCPITEYTAKRLFADKMGLFDTRHPLVTERWDNIEYAFKKIVTSRLREDTVIFFPLYAAEKTSGKTVDHKHRKGFSTILSCFKSLEGDIPRIVCIKDDVTGGANRDSTTGKLKNPKKGGIEIMEEHIKSNDLKDICKAFVKWLIEHPEVNKVFLPDPSMASLIFSNLNKDEIPRSFKGGAYKIYRGSFGNEYSLFGESSKREFDYMVTPSHNNLISYEDRVMSLAGDLMSIMLYREKSPRVKFKILKTPGQVRKIINKIVKDNKGLLSIDLETTGLNPVYPQQSILSCGFSDGKIAYGFLVDHPKYKPSGYGPKTGLKMLHEIMKRKDIQLIAQNAVFDLKWITYFLKYYPDCTIWDTMLLDHWLFETQGSLFSSMESSAAKSSVGGYSMDSQIPRYLKYPSHKDTIDKYKANATPLNADNLPKGKEQLAEAGTVKGLNNLINKVSSDDWLEPGSGVYAQFPLKGLLKYNMLDSYYTYHIFKKQIQMIRAQMDGGKLPVTITQAMPRAIKNIVYMMLNGMPVNYEAIKTKVLQCNAHIMRCKEVFSDFFESGTRRIHGGFDMSVMESDSKFKEFLKANFGVTSDDLWDIDSESETMDDKVLKGLKDKAGDLIPAYIDYKRAIKARNTYLIPFIKLSYKGKLYFDFSLTGTATGRLSSSKPNMQNIPKALTIGGEKIKIKEVLTAEEGCQLIDMDLSSAEVKVLSAVCPDPRLIQVLKDGLDAHSYTASLITSYTYEEIREAHAIMDDKERTHLQTEEIQKKARSRQNAKKVTFGSIYRSGPKGLSKQLSLPPDTKQYTTRVARLRARQEAGEIEASALLDKLFNEVYPELKNVFSKTDKQVFDKHYGQNIFGRRRRYDYTPIPMIKDILVEAGLYNEDSELSVLTLDEAMSLVPNKRPFRQNLNFLVQGPTSEYMQRFIHEIIRRAEEQNLEIIPHITVHDSFVFSYSGKPEDKDAIIAICDDVMNNYLMKLSKHLPVVIGYDYGVSKAYCA